MVQTCGESIGNDEDTEDASEGEEMKLSTPENEKKSGRDSEGIVASGEDQKIPTEKKKEEKTESLSRQQTDLVAPSETDSRESQTQEKKSDPKTEGEVARGGKPEISGTPRKKKNRKLSEAKSEQSPNVPFNKSKIQSPDEKGYMPVVPSPQERRWKKK